ncbi:MAG: T9SS type A sorting domain-containing protein [Candidatus Electryonea clarkiae]|nr:T9SS type A sorting domain-containing protein [Candidatus Electryonea clarkiae]MDP8285105.1 T9SS type A sorting domain-containing protein [Candidatus Electryonea clarkiae]
MIKRLTVILLLLSLSAGLVNAFPARVLFEEFTAEWCPPCAPASRVFGDFIEDEHETISVIIHHASTDPWYDINGPEHEARFTYYGITGIPHCKADGIIGFHPGVRNNINNAYYQRIIRTAPVSIDLLTYLNDDGVNVTATVTSEDDAIAGNYKIRFAIVSTLYEEYTGSNGQDTWHYDLLDLAPDEDGLDFSIDADDTETFSTTFDWPFALRGDPVSEDNMHVIAFIQNDGNREVIQSQMAEVGYGGFMVDSGESAHLVSAEGTAEYEFEISNLMGESDTYVLAVEDDFPDDWSYTYTTPDGEVTGNGTITIDGSDTFTSTITVTTGSDEGMSGNLTVNITSENVEGIESNLSYFTMSAGRVLIVNGDPDGQHADYYTDAIEGIEEPDEAVVSYAVWPVASNAMDMSEVSGSDVEMVIWYLGEGGTLSAADVSGLEDYLESGGNLVLTGSDAPDILNAMEDISLLEMMGVTSPSRFASQSVSGVNSDPIGDGMEFNITGGDGAGNAGTPCSIRAEGTGEYSMIYTSVHRAAVRNETDTYKSLLMGFPFEAIATEEDRTALMLVFLEYFINFEFDSTPENSSDIPVHFALEQNYPNPFNPSTEIAFSVPELAEVTISVFDVTGREITRLADKSFQPGSHKVTWSAENVSSGVYFYSVSAKGETNSFSSVRKMVLMK